MNVSADYGLCSVIFRISGEARLPEERLERALKAIAVPSRDSAEAVSVSHVNVVGVMGHPGWRNVCVAWDRHGADAGTVGAAAWTVLRGFLPSAVLASAPWEVR